ncbi:MAG TPA: hypothetical protein VHI13_14840 [Candidatus Kapabacteria bacterium]|nr:hypothetical protein [Candidatus Kapabacteria bacterium]
MRIVTPSRAYFSVGDRTIARPERRGARRPSRRSGRGQIGAVRFGQEL